MVVIGVLHCVDLGVTAEVVGNIFWEYLQKMSSKQIGDQGAEVADQAEGLVQDQSCTIKATRSDKRYDQEAEEQIGTQI